MIAISGLSACQPSAVLGAPTFKKQQQPVLFGSQDAQPQSIYISSWQQKSLSRLYDLLTKQGWLNGEEQRNYRATLKSIQKEGKKGKRALSAEKVSQLKGFLKVSLDKMEAAGYVSKTRKVLSEESEYESLQSYIGELPESVADPLLFQVNRWNSQCVKEIIKLYDQMCQHNLLSDQEEAQYNDLVKTLKSLKRKQLIPPENISDVKAFLRFALNRIDSKGLIAKKEGGATGKSEYYLFLQDFDETPHILAYYLIRILPPRMKVLNAWAEASESQRTKMLNRANGETVLNAILDALPKIHSTGPGGSCGNFGPAFPAWAGPEAAKNQRKDWNA